PAAPAMQMEAPAEGAAPKVNYQDHVLPILKARCAKCHNQDTAKSGLVVDTFAGLMEGGSSGAVIVAGQPDASRLFKLISRAEQPYMPPSGDPLPAEELALIKEWIQSGAPADANAKVAAASTMEAGKTEVFVAAAIVDGPPPMPEVALATPSPELAKRVVARGVATSPRAPLVAVAGYKQVLLYSLADYKLLGALPFPEGEIYTIAFSVNGELLLAGGGVEGDSGRVVVWNVRKAERAGVYGEEYDTILAADVSPDHTMIALGGPSKKVKVYSLADGALLYKLEDHTDWITSLKFSPDGELLATADRAGGLLLWQAANGRAVEALRGHTGALNDLGYSADSTLLASAGADGTVRIWDTWQYKQNASIAAHPGGALSVAFSAANELVTTGSDGLTKRWDVTGKNLATYEKLADWGYQARFGNADALVLAGTWTGDVSVWDIAGNRVATMSTNASS
ncbi:MAG: c-type cytochrome domain-containing protein, partial [Candidatus Hydrogenedentales bacterium]